MSNAATLTGALILLLLCGISTTALAQDDDTTGEPPVLADTDSSDGDAPETENDSNNPATEAALITESDDAEPDTDINNSGDDDTFVPTVQISEDLSVSFPVDI